MVPFVAIESSKTPVTSQISKPANELVNKLLLNWLARSSTINNRELWRSIQAFERPLIWKCPPLRVTCWAPCSGRSQLMSLWFIHVSLSSTQPEYIKIQPTEVKPMLFWVVLFSLPVRSFFIKLVPKLPEVTFVFFVLFSGAQWVLQECVLPGRVQHGGVFSETPTQQVIWSMKDLYFWVKPSTYSSIFAKTKARFFTFKNLQATYEMKVTKYF